MSLTGSYIKDEPNSECVSPMMYFLEVRKVISGYYSLCHLTGTNAEDVSLGNHSLYHIPINSVLHGMPFLCLASSNESLSPYVR